MIEQLSLPTVANRVCRYALLLAVAGCYHRTPDSTRCPADVAEATAGDVHFSFGKVVAVGMGRLKIQEYDFAQDKDVVATYLVTSDTELGNLSNLAELQPGDDVLLDYLERGRDRLVVTLVKEDEEGVCGGEVPPAMIGSLLIAPDFQQVGHAEEGGGLLRSMVGMMALLTDDPAEQERLANMEREPPPPATLEPVPVDLVGIDEWLTVDRLPKKVKPVQNHAFGPHRLRVWRDDEDRSTVALWRDDELQFAFAGHLFVTTGPARSLIPNDEPYTYFTGPPAGTDLDRDGVPDLLLYDYSGGMHCCATVKHIVCSDPPVLTAQISGWHNDPSYADLDGDGKYEMTLGDSSYAYWNACYAASPQPLAVFRISKGRYEMAGDLMRRRSIPADELKVRINNLRYCLGRYDLARARWEEGDVPGRKLTAQEEADDDFFMGQAWRNDHVAIPSVVWELLLNLIYSGQVQEATRGLETMWPKGKPGRNAFAQDLLAMIRGSWHGARLPWLNELERAFHAEFPPPELACSQ